MKKILFLAVALLALMTVLSSCGDGGTVTDTPSTDAPAITDAPTTTEVPAVTDVPSSDTTAEDTSEDAGFDLPMVPV